MHRFSNRKREATNETYEGHWKKFITENYDEIKHLIRILSSYAGRAGIPTREQLLTFDWELKEEASVVKLVDVEKFFFQLLSVSGWTEIHSKISSGSILFYEFDNSLIIDNNFYVSCDGEVLIFGSWNENGKNGRYITIQGNSISCYQYKDNKLEEGKITTVTSFEGSTIVKQKEQYVIKLRGDIGVNDLVKGMQREEPKRYYAVQYFFQDYFEPETACGVKSYDDCETFVSSIMELLQVPATFYEEHDKYEFYTKEKSIFVFEDSKLSFNICMWKNDGMYIRMYSKEHYEEIKETVKKSNDGLGKATVKKQRKI